MVAPQTGALRWTRAAVFTIVAVGLASAAHVAAGHAVPLWTSILAVPVLIPVVHLLAGRRRGVVGLFGAMALLQFVLHLSFLVGSVAARCGTSLPGAGVDPPSGSAVAGGSAVHAHSTVSCATMTNPVDSMHLWPSVAGVLAHLLATVTLVFLLARGESALWALAATLRSRLPLPATPLRLPLRAVSPPVPAAVRRHVPQVHGRTVRRRGPPPVAVAC